MGVFTLLLVVFEICEVSKNKYKAKRLPIILYTSKLYHYIGRKFLLIIVLAKVYLNFILNKISTG